MSRAVVAAMVAYTLELREAGMKLNQNESPFDVPADFKRALFDRVAERPWNRYPDFESTPLREALAREYGLAPENILTGNGSNELLAAAIGTFVGPGTEVIVPRPTFTLYEKLVTVAGGTVIPLELDPRSGILPVPKATPNSVIILCSPNNPTGGVLASLEPLLETGAIVLYDRAYGDFAFDSLPPLNDRLVIFSTFSKAWGLAGLRVGWLATTATTAREIRKVKLPYSLNIVSETAAVLALERRDVRDRFVTLVASERERMAAMMRQIESIEVFPSQANFIAFRTRASRPIFEALCARGILIRDISSYPGLTNCLRVSVGSPAENDAFLAALEEIA